MKHKTKHMITRIGAMLLAALMLISLAACGKESGTGAVIAYAIDAAPVRLDPAIAESASELIIIGNTFEGLVRQTIDETGAARIVPGAAESWEVSSDGRVYTFHLRSNTHWRLHADAKKVLDGKEAVDAFDTYVTAGDFIFGLRRALNPLTKSTSAAALYPIEHAREIHAGELPIDRLGVREINPLTLEITLAQPNDMFLYALTQSAAMPCNQAYFEATKGRYGLGAEYLLCNGPFFVQWSGDTLQRLRRNESYAGERAVLPSAVELRVFEDYAERLQKLGAEAGLDIAAVPTDVISAGLDFSPEELGPQLQNGTISLLFNCSRLSDVNVRTAMCAALSYEALELAPLGVLPEHVQVGGRRLTELAPLQTGIAHNPDRARKLLLEAENSTAPLALICAPEHEQILRKALQQWQSLFGLRLNANIEALEAEELAPRLRQGEYDVAIAALRASSSSALQTMQEFASPGAGNPMRYQSDILDGLLQGAAQMGSAAEAAKAVRQAEAHLLQNGAVYPLMPSAGRLVMVEGVAGLEISPVGDQVFFGRVTKLD